MHMNSYPGPRSLEQDDLLVGDDQAEPAFDRRLPMNPYPGLRPFEQDDPLLGRDGPVDELIRMLKAERFVAVTGVSGKRQILPDPRGLDSRPHPRSASD